MSILGVKNLAVAHYHRPLRRLILNLENILQILIEPLIHIQYVNSRVITYPNVGRHRIAARVPITGPLPTAPAPRALPRDWWRAKHRRGMPENQSNFSTNAQIKTITEKAVM